MSEVMNSIEKHPLYSITGCGCLGNGLTVWDRTVEKHGDYKTLAHISDSGSITWYCKRYRKGHRELIEMIAANHVKTRSLVNEVLQAFHDYQESEK